MQLPVVFNDRYQLVRKIGEGGLAEVFQAQDMSLGRMVAVKVLREQFTYDPTFLVNFHREAQSAAKLNNAYIVAVYDFGQYLTRPYIVMEWIPGSDLRARINEQGVIPVEQMVEYTIQICSAVGTAHRAGLVHGDLKPGNILINAANIVKVTDFGLARALGESAMDEDEVVWGTPAYFAPEQASGDMMLPATDVYAIGVIMYEMVMGRVPFVGVDDQEVARKQLYEAHIPVDQLDPAIPEPLARIIDAAMAKSPNERFLTADHLREALILYRQGGLTLTSQHGPIASVVGSPVQPGRVASPPKSPPAARVPPRKSPPPPPARSNQSAGGIDMMMLALGVIAIVAVLGLVPLFVAVVDAYATRGVVAAPAQIQVPDVVGLEENRARTILAGRGLELVVTGEAADPTWPVFAIISQSIPAGSMVERGAVVEVVLSRGPSMVEIPDVMGQTFDQAEQALVALDLVPQKYEDWSIEPVGQVIGQDPPAHSVVSNRSLVALIVSSGSRTPVGANFGGEILLSAYEIPRLQYKAGEQIKLVFFWQTLAVPAQDYNVFIYLTTPQGGIVSQIDTQPQGGPRFTTNWQIGEVMVDPYQLAVPPTTPPGNYQIRVGFYNPATNTRLSILDPGRGQSDNLGSLIIRTVQVIE
jgi:serine/threonine-protein kinase